MTSKSLNIISYLFSSYSACFIDTIWFSWSGHYCSLIKSCQLYGTCHAHFCHQRKMESHAVHKPQRVFSFFPPFFGFSGETLLLNSFHVSKTPKHTDEWVSLSIVTQIHKNAITHKTHRHQHVKINN